MALVTHLVVPAGHEMPQQLAHLRVQAHPSLRHRLPQPWKHRPGLRRSFPCQPLQDRRQDPVRVGRGILVDAPDVPPHGAPCTGSARLPVQPRRVQGRPWTELSSAVTLCFTPQDHEAFDALYHEAQQAGLFSDEYAMNQCPEVLLRRVLAACAALLLAGCRAGIGGDIPQVDGPIPGLEPAPDDIETFAVVRLPQDWLLYSQPPEVYGAPVLRASGDTEWDLTGRWTVDPGRAMQMKEIRSGC